MILDSLQNKERYVSLHPRFKAVFDFIDTHDVAALPCGRHEIDGDEVFANVQELVTVPAGEKNYEAHRRYADIHYVISGTELIGIAPVGECEPVGEFSEADDFGLFTPGGREAWATLRPGGSPADC